MVPTKPPCTEECGDMRCPHALDQEISGMLPAAVVASVSSAPGLVPLLIALRIRVADDASFVGCTVLDLEGSVVYSGQLSLLHPAWSQRHSSQACQHGACAVPVCLPQLAASDVQCFTSSLQGTPVIALLSLMPCPTCTFTVNTHDWHVWRRCFCVQA